jgi:hypothetical protein
VAKLISTFCLPVLWELDHYYELAVPLQQAGSTTTTSRQYHYYEQAVPLLRAGSTTTTSRQYHYYEQAVPLLRAGSKTTTSRQYHYYDLAVPLLRAGGEECKIILYRLLRYIGNKCCNNRAWTHQQLWRQTILWKARRWPGRNNGLDQGIGAQQAKFGTARWRAPTDCWKWAKTMPKLPRGSVYTYRDSDPVHMGADGYRQLSNALLDIVAEKVAEQHHQLPMHSNRKGTVSRHGWTDDAVARRADNYASNRGGRAGRLQSWGSGRGRAAARGGRRLRGYGGQRFRPLLMR